MAAEVKLKEKRKKKKIIENKKINLSGSDLFLVIVLFIQLSPYASPAFLKLTDTRVTPTLSIAITKNVVTRPKREVSVELKFEFALAAAT